MEAAWSGARRDLSEPVSRIPGDSSAEPTTGSALCLSGGGYRAMLFHTGVLWRLFETGQLQALDRISSVSGGSIASAQLALSWEGVLDGGPRAFERDVVTPLRQLARRGLDVISVVTGLATSDSIGERLAGAYRKRLYGDATLQDLPDTPRFIFNATNAGSGEICRFEKEKIADWRVGRIPSPDVPVAVAVACSSAFPPVLSPFRLDTRAMQWEDEDGNDLSGPEFRDELALTDGGAYDNLGIETAWKKCRTILVSDAGGFLPEEADPAGDWAHHLSRVIHIVDNQVRSLRKRQVIGGYESGTREGVYLGIRSNLSHYETPDRLPCPIEQTLRLAETRTRLAALPELTQERLINWGYAICDAGLRAHMGDTTPPASAFPYPEAAVGKND